MKIKSLAAHAVLDSRGQWTVEAAIELGSGVRAVASVPQGKSTGAAEAVALSAPEAVRSINNVIAPKVVARSGRGLDFKDQKAFDTFLIALDGTPMKKKLGANAILTASIAFARASASAKGVPFWQYLRENFDMPVSGRGTTGSGTGSVVH